MTLSSPQEEKDLDSWAETIPRQVIEKIEKIVISCLFIRLFSD